MKGNKLKHSFYESEDVCYEQTELPSRTNIESVSVSNTITNVMVALHPMSIEYTKREMLKTLCNYLYENGFIESTQQRDDFHNNIILELKIKAKKNMKTRILKMITAEAEAKREKALTSLELLLEKPVGIGDHSTGDFYNNIDEAFRALIDADDVLDTIKKYNWNNISDIG